MPIKFRINKPFSTFSKTLKPVPKMFSTSHFKGFPDSVEDISAAVWVFN